MSFFKKIFRSKVNKEPEQSVESRSDLEPYQKVPWMTDTRLQNLAICLDAGFKPASSLPTEFDRQLRSTIEIAQRLHALKALILWLMVPQENLPNDKIIAFIEQNDLMSCMTDEEKMILNLSRDDQQARNAIGWKFENC